MPRISATVSEKIEKKIIKHKKQFGITKSRTIERLIDFGCQSLEVKAISKPSPNIITDTKD